jgi:hypothetical protein
LAILRSSTPAAAAAVAYPARSELAGKLGGGDAGRAGAALDDQRDRLIGEPLVSQRVSRRRSRLNTRPGGGRPRPRGRRAACGPRTVWFLARAYGTATWAPARLLAGVFWRRGSLTSSPREASKARSPVADAQRSANAGGVLRDRAPEVSASGGHHHDAGTDPASIIVVERHRVRGADPRPVRLVGHDHGEVRLNTLRTGD